MTKITKVAVDAQLVAAAEILGLDITREVDVHMGGRLDRRRRENAWRRRNREAIQAWNGCIDENGIPFEQLRPW